jgi:hypothetical protein
MESADLAARAQRAYETGRLRWAAQIAWVVVTLVAVSFVSVGPSPISAAMGVALLGAATAMRWRGQAWGAGVRSGFLAGLIPFALLLSMKCSGYFCTMNGCLLHCTRYCALGGLAAGVLLAMRATRRQERIVEFLLASSIVAALTGLLGCFVGGMTGMFWMAVGELAATAPAFALQLRRR